MARFIGLDIGARYIRVAVLTTAYRRVKVERLEEVPIGAPEELRQAITAAAAPVLTQVDGLATSLDGDLSFVHRIALPPTATKQLADVLPFELEAQVPVDLAELVYDHRLLRRENNQAPLTVLVAAARLNHVKARIDLVREALGREPDRVASGSMALANLASVSTTLRGPGPVAILDLGGRRTEVTFLSRGEPVFVRTLSRGVEGLPAAAGALASELRQTLLAWSAQGHAEVAAVYLAGGGAFAEGADKFLAAELNVPVTTLPALELEGTAPEVTSAMPRFAKAIALALGAAGRGHDVDLRRGPLAFQRGFGFLKEKAPVLIGLASAIFVSFLFATWAEVRALAQENALLSEELRAVSKEVLGKELTDAEAAAEAVQKERTSEDSDPLPQMDAFDVIVQFSKVVPTTVTHDIEEFDMQRGHVKIQGVLGSATEAQNIASEFAKQRCLSEAKIGKVTQVVNSDRQKYVLDVDVKCPDENKKKKKDDAGTEKAAEKDKTESAAP